MEDYIKQNRNKQAQKIIDYYDHKLVDLAGDVVEARQGRMENISIH